VSSVAVISFLAVVAGLGSNRPLRGRAFPRTEPLVAALAAYKGCSESSLAILQVARGAGLWHRRPLPPGFSPPSRAGASIKLKSSGNQAKIKRAAPIKQKSRENQVKIKQTPKYH